MELSEKQSHHQIIMQNRSLLELTDVEDVDAFDEKKAKENYNRAHSQKILLRRKLLILMLLCLNAFS